MLTQLMKCDEMRSDSDAKPNSRLVSGRIYRAIIVFFLVQIFLLFVIRWLGDSKSSNNISVQIRGTSSKVIPPDTLSIVFNAKFNFQAVPRNAFQTVENILTALLKETEFSGRSATEIALNSEIYSNKKSVAVGYAANATIPILFRDFSKVRGALVHALTSGVKSIGESEFSISKPVRDAANEHLSQLAYEDLESNAKFYAQVYGFALISCEKYLRSDVSVSAEDSVASGGMSGSGGVGGYGSSSALTVQAPNLRSISEFKSNIEKLIIPDGPSLQSVYISDTLDPRPEVVSVSVRRFCTFRI